ncbi:differentially expressed in FDCP 8 homolog A-like [Pollicipes pollicipes]|uniref:differentially expressed in FDCP 8 homolog A-like n=1 Tax=Pollicipes pollicipes TaxID=41117 RepID=UPI001884B85C|nr:differentially expressed in FDCP 8 homolog A-like [Pollicipes pollicipes]
MGAPDSAAGCSLCVHVKCAGKIRRRCAAERVRRHPAYSLRICPETGLSGQKFKCAECARFVLPDASWTSRGALYAELDLVSSPRLCDYTGRYFCARCHRGDRAIIPARAIRNWDFHRYPVSCGVREYLELMFDRPVLDVEEANHLLFSYVEELGHVRELRQRLVQMRRCALPCPADGARLPSWLEARPHLLGSPRLYSLRDLSDVWSGQLAAVLVKAHDQLDAHLRKRCETCRRTAQTCQLCWEGAPLFPFDAQVSACVHCRHVMHAHCRALQAGSSCPCCQRTDACTDADGPDAPGDETDRRHADGEEEATEEGDGGTVAGGGRECGDGAERGSGDGANGVEQRVQSGRRRGKDGTETEMRQTGGSGAALASGLQQPAGTPSGAASRLGTRPVIDGVSASSAAWLRALDKDRDKDKDRSKDGSRHGVRP